MKKGTNAFPRNLKVGIVPTLRLLKKGTKGAFVFSLFLTTLGLLSFCRAARTAPSPKDNASALSPLEELNKRQIISPDAEDYTEEDLQTLVRMKKAESLGAIDFLAHKLGDIQAFTFETHGKTNSPIELNQAGFEKYLFFLSQKAINYFASRHVEPKRVFGLTDALGRKVFDKNGLLTLSGENLFDKILEKRPVEWELSGKIMANHKIKKESLSPAP